MRTPNKPVAPKPFAYGTDVPAERSRAELESLLDKHKATETALYRDKDRTVLVFRMNGRMVKIAINRPTEADLPKPGRKRTPSEVEAAIEAEWRRRWRARVMILKGKLEQIYAGESTVEVEFLADTMLANGKTVAEVMLPRIAESYQSGDMPSLMLGSGDK